MPGGIALYLLLAITAFSIVALALFHSHLKLKISYKRIENNDIITLAASAFFGIIKYKAELPFLDFVKKMDNFAVRFRLRLKSGKEIQDEIRFKRIESLDELLSSLDDMMSYYRLNKKAIKYLAKKAQIRDFCVYSAFGFDDAYITGVMYGILYTVIVNFLAFIKAHIDLYIKAIDLKPVFNKEVFHIMLNCIIDIKIGHIITALRMFIKTSRGSEIDGTTYSRTYENNYGKY
ncbi:hypothetical protein SDC9_167456 [bioreactor metagenome]|uniref:DUF2953 domain-containing protein n=1 Tax=bioreactor metagenome TaxID=1076179 RepID=A0A645G2N8_9ZZZZ